MVESFKRTRKPAPKVIFARKNGKDDEKRGSRGRGSKVERGGREKRVVNVSTKGDSEERSERIRREDDRDPRGRRKDNSSPGPKSGTKQKQRFFEGVAKKNKKKKPKKR